MHFVGVDLAWTEKNETGLAVIDSEGKLLDLRAGVYSNEEITEYIEQFSGNQTHAAIDAPLVVPNESGSRPAERELPTKKVGGNTLRAFHCSRNYLIGNYGSVRAEEIASLLADYSIDLHPNKNSIIETFPTGILASMFPDDYPFSYKRKSGITLPKAKDEMYRLINQFPDLQHLKVEGKYTGKVHKHIEDQVDAYLCAYGLYKISQQDWDYQMFGNVNEGFIILP